MIRIRQSAVRDVFENAIEMGIEAGFRRAYKHNDNPAEEAIVSAIFASVMLNIDESFQFPEPDYED